jgi:hypothetical protein
MHVKTNGGVASGAFLLSFFVGLIGGAGFPMLLVRALVFAVFAVVLSEAIHLVAKQFLIASASADKEARPAGSHVDISVEGDSGAEPSEPVAIMDHAPAGGAGPVKPTAALSDEELLLGALPASEAPDMEAGVPAETADDGDAAGAGAESAAAAPAEFGAMDMLFPNTPMPLKDVKLPDIERMTGAFVEKEEEELFEPPPRKHTENAVGALGKNYDPAKVANAIKTLLQRK